MRIKKTITNFISSIVSFFLSTFDKFDFKVNSIQVANPYLRLMRIHKPLPYLLLMMPIVWFITSISNALSWQKTAAYLFLAIVGSFCTRSAGCIINDIIDRKFDNRVHRTRLRPITSGELTVKQALIPLAILILISLLLLIFFSEISIYIALCAGTMAVIYPYLKRFTSYPQVFLGATWNAGILVFGFTLSERFPLSSIALYIGTIFWVVAYDSIYAVQDFNDDMKIGLSSMATRFGDKILVVVKSSYNIFLLFMICFSFISGISYPLLFICALLVVYYIFHYQIEELDIYNIRSLEKNFTMNCFVALLIEFALIICV